MVPNSPTHGAIDAIVASPFSPRFKPPRTIAAECAEARLTAFRVSALSSPLDMPQSYHAFTSKHAHKRPRDPNLLTRSVMEDLIGEKMDGTPLEKPHL